MERETLKKLLATNIATNRENLEQKFKEYDLLCLGRDMQEQRFRDITDRILADNVFTVTAPLDGEPRAGIPGRGERILSNEFTFLLDDKDHERLRKLREAACLDAGLTDEEGHDREPWTERCFTARRDLLTYILDNVIPNCLRETLAACRKSHVRSEQLLDIIRTAIT